VSAPASGAATRGLAARAVARVLVEGRTLDVALQLPEMDSLAAADRAQVRALAYGATRWHHRHRRLLGELLHRPSARLEPELEALLSVGLFQVLDAAQPDYAAVSATVAAARWLGRSRATGLVNAALRRMQRERTPLLAAALAADDGRYSCPSWLIDRLRSDWPRDWQPVLEASLQAPPLWLRVNRLRRDPAEYRAELATAGIESTASPELPFALRLARATPVAGIPGFLAGEVSVQDVAAQVAGLLLDVAPGMRVLDACAAPGGKATQLLELAAGEIDLLALDHDATRLVRVGENLERLGLRATTVCADAREPSSWWDGRPFDRILVDVPCSGTGVIRRHPDIKLLRRPGDIGPLAGRQRAILDAVWPLLTRGGQLLYVSCSILSAENTAVVGAFLAAHPQARLERIAPATLPDWLRPLPDAGWQSLPGAADTDGLYYALMTRAEP